MQILPRQILSDAALISDAAAAVTAFRSHSPDLSKPPSNWIFISFLPRHILLIFPIFAKGRHSDPPNELRRAFVSAGMTSESCDLISPMYARFARNRKKKKCTHAKVSRWGKAAAHSTGALGISSLSFLFLFVLLHVDRMYYAFLNIAIGLSSDVIDIDVVLRSRETKVDTYVAGCERTPFLPLLSVSFLISVRSPRFYCLIVPRRADVSSNRIHFLPSPSFVIAVFFHILFFGLFCRDIRTIYVLKSKFYQTIIYTRIPNLIFFFSRTSALATG